MAAPGSNDGSQVFSEMLSPTYPIKWKAQTKYRLAIHASDPGITVGLDLLGDTKVGTNYIGDGKTLDFTTPVGMYDGMCQVKCIVKQGVSGWFQIAVFEI